MDPYDPSDEVKYSFRRKIVSNWSFDCLQYFLSATLHYKPISATQDGVTGEIIQQWFIYGLFIYFYPFSKQIISQPFFHNQSALYFPSEFLSGVLSSCPSYCASLLGANPLRSSYIFFHQKIVSPMQKQINQISFRLALSLLADYVADSTPRLKQLEKRFEGELRNRNGIDLHEWLIDRIKNANNQIRTLLQGTRQHMEEMQLKLVFDFFDKCSSLMDRHCKHLATALIDTINKKIDVVHLQTFPSLVVPQIQGTKQIDMPVRDQRLKKTREVSRDLENLDYFLSLINNQDNKSYNEYKSQCERLLLKKDYLQQIKPSQAIREISEAAHEIELAMENSTKALQETYMMKYLDFKQLLKNLQNSDGLNEIFMTEMQNANKEKFKEGINRALKKCYEISKKNHMKDLTHASTQTEESKGARMQEKMQNLLIVEKRNNEKLLEEIRLLKKYKSKSEETSELQKMLESSQSKRRQAQNRYTILESIYNQKCDEAGKAPKHCEIVRKSVCNKVTINKAMQTENKAKQFSVQTDNDFYYYFQSAKIHQYRVKIMEFEEIVRHKDYLIKQLQAVRTFRDNFKSKRQICSNAIKSTKSIAKAKSLHYLDEQDQICDIKDEQKMKQPQSKRVLRKKVTLQELTENQNKPMILNTAKINKKKAETFKSRPYFAFNDRVEDEEELQDNPKSQQQLQKVSLKSILKLGSNQFKKQLGIQTDQLSFEDMMGSKAGRTKNNSRLMAEKSLRRVLRPSDQSSVNRSFQKKSYIFNETTGAFKKSNFVALNELNESKENSSKRMSDLSPPSKMLSVRTHWRGLDQVGKMIESRVNTVGGQMLHLNNSLNSNFLIPISTSNLKHPTTSKSKFKMELKGSNRKGKIL